MMLQTKRTLWHYVNVLDLTQTPKPQAQKWGKPTCVIRVPFALFLHMLLKTAALELHK